MKNVTILEFLGPTGSQGVVSLPKEALRTQRGCTAPRLGAPHPKGALRTQSARSAPKGSALHPKAALCTQEGCFTPHSVVFVLCERETNWWQNYFSLKNIFWLKKWVNIWIGNFSFGSTFFVCKNVFFSHWGRGTNSLCVWGGGQTGATIKM
jgi:hypothetical protein